jgi:hypothetical protein
MESILRQSWVSKIVAERSLELTPKADIKRHSLFVCKLTQSHSVSKAFISNIRNLRVGCQNSQSRIIVE